MRDGERKITTVILTGTVLRFRRIRYAVYGMIFRYNKDSDKSYINRKHFLKESNGTRKHEIIVELNISIRCDRLS